MRHCVGIRLLTWGIVAALALGLGACRGASPPSGAISPTPQRSVTPPTSASPATSPTSGPVAVAVDEPHYTPADTIVVSIHNGLATPLFARDERSDCTLVDLERWVNGVWQIQAPCVNMQPAPRVVQLTPGTVLTQQLAPGQSDSSGDGWSVGTYRITFAYVTSANQPFGQSTVVYSASFVVG
jgi:hypothetical protein